MSVQTIYDITADLNDNSNYNLDVGGWDYAVVHLVSPTGTFSFTTSNDANAITGASDGNATSATNFLTVVGTLLSDNSTVSTLAASGMVRFTSVGRFLRLAAPGAAQVTKALVRLYKIH
jgi:hypothetical protein